MIFTIRDENELGNPQIVCQISKKWAKFEIFYPFSEVKYTEFTENSHPCTIRLFQ